MMVRHVDHEGFVTEPVNLGGAEDPVLDDFLPLAQLIYAIEMQNLLLKIHRNHCLEINFRKSTMLPVAPFSSRMVVDSCFTIYKRITKNIAVGLDHDTAYRIAHMTLKIYLIAHGYVSFHNISPKYRGAIYIVHDTNIVMFFNSARSMAH